MIGVLSDTVRDNYAPGCAHLGAELELAPELRVRLHDLHALSRPDLAMAHDAGHKSTVTVVVAIT